MKLGLIGLGSMGKIHLYNSLRLENAKLVAVADSSKRALQLAEKTGVKRVQRDYNKLLNDPNVDAVIISLPTFLHCECAVKAAEAKKDIFLEKPLARNIEEGKQIVSKAKQEGVKLMVGYPLRFSEQFAKLKKKLEEGNFGDIQLAIATSISAGPFSPRASSLGPAPVPSWWFDKNLSGGGALLDLGSHMINLLRWYFGDVIGVKSYLGHRFHMDFEDHATSLLKFKNNLLAIVNVGWFSMDYRVSVELYGTVRQVSEVHTPPSFKELATDAVRKKLRKIEMKNLAYYSELRYFVECVDSDKTPNPSGENGLSDLETISAAYNNTFRFLNCLNSWLEK